MKNRHLALFFIAIVTTIAIVFSACKKINESTDLGGGLIPPVDNITTFDTIVDLQTFNDTFAFANDSVRLGPGDEFFLGKITNDLFFGATDAELFLQLKPPTYPFSFKNIPHPDSLQIDSVVLVLDYVETYGDTMAPQTITVYEMDQSIANKNFRSDSSYLIRKNDFTFISLLNLGSRTFLPTALKDSVKAFGGDTTKNQLRIKLNNSFGTRLLQYDSTINGAYANDSVFTSKFKGFALKSTAGGNALMGFNLTGANTKLAIYYKYAEFQNNIPDYDTAVAYFVFGTACAHANYIKRDYSGTPALASLNNGPAADPIVYLQTTPGFFTTIKMPGLGTVNNRVVHRAEIIMEQLYDISDSTYRSPDFLFLDAIDPTITSSIKFRSIPYDLFYDFGTFSYTNLVPFGVVPIIKTDGVGNNIRTWKFNVTRYVQHVLTGTVPLYDLRVFPAFRHNIQYGIPPGADALTSVFVNGSAVKGRIRLHGNNGSGDINPQRMRLRIIYSKL